MGLWRRLKNSLDAFRYLNLPAPKGLTAGNALCLADIQRSIGYPILRTLRTPYKLDHIQ